MTNDPKLRLKQYQGRIYIPVEEPVNSGEILEYEDKQWVRAEDYVTLHARLAEVEAAAWERWREVVTRLAEAERLMQQAMDYREVDVPAFKAFLRTTDVSPTGS